MSQTPSTSPAHPIKRLRYRDALSYLERWIEAEILTEEERSERIAVSIVDYFDRKASKRRQRPWCGVRVVEVDFHTEYASGSYSQSEAPFGIAICAQVERCILALLEGWNRDAERPESYETDEEFDRLRYFFQQAGHRQAGTPVSDTEFLRLIVDHEAGLPSERTVRASYLSCAELGDALAIDDPTTVHEIAAALRRGVPYHDRLGEEDVYLIVADNVSCIPAA